MGSVKLCREDGKQLLVPIVLCGIIIFKTATSGGYTCARALGWRRRTGWVPSNPPPEICSSGPGHSAQLHLLCEDSRDPEPFWGLAALGSRKQNPVQTSMALKDFYSETQQLLFQPPIILLFHRNVSSQQTGTPISMNLHVLMLVHMAGFSSGVSLAIRGQCSIVAKTGARRL